jgi:hypothetical protein
MVTLCQGWAFPEGALAGPILSANVVVHVGHGTRPPDGGEDHSSRRKPSYTMRPVFEPIDGVLRVQVWKRLYCSSRLFSDAMSSLT